MANIYIPRVIGADDADTKSGKASVALHNGDLVTLGARDKYGLYELTLATDNDTDVYVVYNADVPTEGMHRGLVDDPRLLEHKAGRPVDIYAPQKNDEVAITKAGIAGSEDKYVVVDNAGQMKFAADVPTDGLCYRVEETTFVSVGMERVPTVELTCVQA